MNSRIRFPIRLKVLLAVLTMLTVTVAVITASMARAFGEDKVAYVNDVSAIIASSAAAESATVLRGYLHGMDVIAAILTSPNVDAVSREQVAARLFTRLPDFLSVSLVTEGLTPTTFYDPNGLSVLGISGEELVTRALTTVAGVPAAGSEGLRIGTLALPRAEPLLVLARSLPPAADEPPRFLVACVRLGQLAHAVERGRGFRSALVDSTGKVLVASAGEASNPWIAGMLEQQAPIQAGVVTREFTADGTVYIAARSAVRVGGVFAITAIPRTAAYLSARGLLDSLLVVSIALIVGGALVAVLVSRRLTKPIEKLAEAAGRIGQGRFDVMIRAESSDEIGALAGAFNSMASGLQERERALAQAQQALIRSEKMSAFGQLSAGIAHEVKNPLAGILGHAQLAMRRLGPDSPARASLDMIAGETRRCSEIIANLMHFARQDKPHFLRIDPNEVVEAALAIVDHQLGLQGIRIVRDLGPRLPAVEGDFNQLQQVLVNLAINAQQAMAGSRGELRVRTRAAGDEVLIEVQDTGPGIAPELQTRIFEPFFTTKAAGQGTGLGLSVSYGIVESHGGRLELRSVPGEGATFIIALCAAAAHQAEAAA